MKSRLVLRANVNDEIVASVVLGEKVDGRYHTIGGGLQAGADLSEFFQAIGRRLVAFSVHGEIVFPLDQAARQLSTSGSSDSP